MALVAALAGTALAGSDPGAGSSSVKNDAKTALKLAKKNKKSIKNIELTPGPRGDTGEKGDTGANGAAGASATELFAQVTDKGALLNGQGVSSTKQNATGEYAITFDQDISSCAVTGNTGEFSKGGAALGEGFVSFDVGLVARASAVVDVHITNAAAVPTNSSFSIAAFC